MIQGTAMAFAATQAAQRTGPQRTQTGVGPL